MIAHCEKHNNDYMLEAGCYYCNTNSTHPSGKSDTGSSPDVDAMKNKEAEIYQRKRDRFEAAKVAMGALLAGGGYQSRHDLVEDAVLNADALLAKLDKGGDT